MPVPLPTSAMLFWTVRLANVRPLASKPDVVWKVWVLQRARRDIVRGVALFWSADSIQAGRKRLGAADREGRHRRTSTRAARAAATAASSRS